MIVEGPGKALGSTFGWEVGGWEPAGGYHAAISREDTSGVGWLQRLETNSSVLSPTWRAIW